MTHRKAPVPRPVIAAVAATAALLSACAGGSSSFDQPKAEAFHEGPCRAVAASILKTGRLAHDLGSSTSPSAQVRTQLKAAQDQLIAVRPALPAELTKPLGDLIVSIGPQASSA